MTGYSLCDIRRAFLISDEKKVRFRSSIFWGVISAAMLIFSWVFSWYSYWWLIPAIFGLLHYGFISIFIVGYKAVSDDCIDDLYWAEIQSKQLRKYQIFIKVLTKD